MRKLKRIAVLFGGNSTEYAVSLESAAAVLDAMNPEKYDVVPVGITRNGKWFHFRGAFEQIKNGTWVSETDQLSPVSLPLDSANPGLLVLNEAEHQYSFMKIDLAFPVLHGKNGEDGTVQGMLELAGIPIVGCGTLSSALCMDKARAHKLVESFGMEVPKSISFNKTEYEKALSKIRTSLSYPLFIKPVRSGSSIGISRIKEETELGKAVDQAFLYDSEIIVEEEVRGVEVGCAIMGCDTLIAGRVDEIELSGDFFDFHEKYTLETSAIHMPARIGKDTEALIRKKAMDIYRILGCSGFARVDMFLTESGTIVFNEVNTIPGMTSHSRFPNMMNGAGISFPEMIDRLTGMYAQ